MILCYQELSNATTLFVLEGYSHLFYDPFVLWLLPSAFRVDFPADESFYIIVPVTKTL